MKMARKRTCKLFAFHTATISTMCCGDGSASFDDEPISRPSTVESNTGVASTIRTLADQVLQARNPGTLIQQYCNTASGRVDIEIPRDSKIFRLYRVCLRRGTSTIKFRICEQTIKLSMSGKVFAFQIWNKEQEDKNHIHHLGDSIETFWSAKILTYRFLQKCDYLKRLGFNHKTYGHFSHYKRFAL